MADIRHLAPGLNQSGLRAFNERLILTMLQRNGPTAARDLAQQSGLSSQTVSVILRKLEADGLVQRGTPQRGKVGKPRIPVALNPDGLFSVGLKIGRRSAEVILMDLTGTLRHQIRLDYSYPTPAGVFGVLHDSLSDMTRILPETLRSRICGIGVAAPFQLWNWRDLVPAPPDAFDAWRQIDIPARIAEHTDLSVLLVNDTTAACRAELIYGGGKRFRDYAYFYLGAFVGGGIVMNHAVVEGQFSNAGAMGSLPMTKPDGTPGQLIDLASIHTLERQLTAAGIAGDVLWTQPQNWDSIERHVAPWIARTGAALAKACLATCAVIDFEAIVIDGALPAPVKARLVQAIQSELPRQTASGLVLPQITAGDIGPQARSIGAACGPIISAVLLDEVAGAKPHGTNTSRAEDMA